MHVSSTSIDTQAGGFHSGDGINDEQMGNVQC